MVTRASMQHGGIIFTLGLCFFAAGCPTTPYDDATDKSVTALQQKIDSYIDRATTQPTDPSFYSSISIDLHSLEIRETARLSGQPVDSMKPTTQQVNELETTVDHLKTVDEGTNGQRDRPKAIKAEGDSLDRIFESLLHLELFRKTS